MVGLDVRTLKLDHLISQIFCLTAGSHEPRASQGVAAWEDHRLHARNFQNADVKSRVEPQASFQKEAEGVACPVPPPEGVGKKGSTSRRLYSRTARNRKQGKTCSVDSKG